MRIKIIHKRVPETASDCVSCVSVGLLWRSSTNFFVSVVVCWLFIRNRTAENILKWKIKDRRAVVISQGLSSKLGNLAEVRYLGNLLYLDCPSHIDRQSPMGGNCRQQLYIYIFFFKCAQWSGRQTIGDDWLFWIFIFVQLKTMRHCMEIQARRQSTVIWAFLSVEKLFLMRRKIIQIGLESPSCYIFLFWLMLIKSVQWGTLKCSME